MTRDNKLTALLQSMAWRAEREFARHHGELTAMLWLAETAGGERTWFETPCNAPHTVDDATAIAVLVDELRDDFARDGVVRYAVAYEGFVIFTTAGAQRRLDAVIIEAVGSGGALRGVREIVRSGRRPYLAAVAIEKLSSSSFPPLADAP